METTITACNRIGLAMVMSAAAFAALARPLRGEPTFAGGVNQGNVNAPAIVEASGITASRNNDGVIWVHNDSGDVARIFALDSQGRLLGTYNITLPGTSTFAEHRDFEDIAIGPGPESGVTYVYVGDIGDNSSSRVTITVYRIAEPVVYGRQAASPITQNLNQGEWQAVVLQYPGTWPQRARNAETLMVDPLTGDLFVVTKQSGTAEVYRASAADLASGSTVIMSLVRTIDFDVASGGCISPTGGEIIIRQETFARLWTRVLSQSVADALGGTPVSIPLALEPNGEAVTFDAIGHGYFTLSEGTYQPLYYFARTSDDGPMQPIVLLAAESQWTYRDDGSDQGTAWRQPGFDDGSWSTGPAQLGYGDGDEQTVVSFGADPSDKHITTYFRKTFQADSVARLDSLLLKVVYDDGIAVYLNNTEIARCNLAADAGFDDPATEAQQAMENTWLAMSVDPNLLVDGTNTLAVEVHLDAADSPDLSFDLQLLATARPARLEVSEVNPSWGVVDIDPEPNDPNDMEFPRGTVVTLTAFPIEGKALRHWEMFNPDHPDDGNYATIDANEITRIVMNSDMHVRAVWMCGSGAGMMPLVLLIVLMSRHVSSMRCFP